jgi:hypothetical protein
MKALIYSELLRLKGVTLRAFGLNLLALVLIISAMPSLLVSANGVFLLTLIYALGATMMAMQHASALTKAAERAFLIHRPVKLNTIGSAVILAGMLSVSVAFLLPFVISIVLSLAWNNSFTWAHLAHLAHLAILSISVIVCFCSYLAGLVKQHCNVLVGWLICALPLMTFAFGHALTMALMALFIVLFVVLLVLYQRLFSLIEPKPSRLMGLPLIVVVFALLSNLSALSYQMFIIAFDDDFQNDWVAYYPVNSIAQLKSLENKPKVQALLTLADVNLPTDAYASTELLPNRLQNFPFEQNFTVTHFGADGKKTNADNLGRLSLWDDSLTVHFPLVVNASAQPMSIKLKAQAKKVISINVVHTTQKSFITVLYKPKVLSEQGLPFFELFELQHAQHAKQAQPSMQRKVVELAFSWADVYRLRNYIISPLLAGLNTMLIERNPAQFSILLRSSLSGGISSSVLWLMVAVSILSLLVTWRLNLLIGLPKAQQQGWLLVNALTGICGLLTFVMIYFVQIKNTPALLDSS